MQVAVHWQDADPSSAKALISEVFPDADITICGGHAKRAQRKILELRHKMKKVPKKMLQKYRDTFPALGKLRLWVLESIFYFQGAHKLYVNFDGGPITGRICETCESTGVPCT